MAFDDSLSLERWLNFSEIEALLDIGCNVGHLLESIANTKPHIRLAGIEVNADALRQAKDLLPGASLHVCGAEALPFEDVSFDCATCIEVLEHIPAPLRRRSLEEIHRVLKSGGTLLLQVPHAGTFAWLDPGNLRFQFPKLFSALIGKGLRDAGMRERAEGVIWHHHFSFGELESLSSGLFEIERAHYGGLFLMPLTSIARWPFYKLRRYDGRLFQLLIEASRWDLCRDYGERAYDIRLLLRKRR